MRLLLDTHTLLWWLTDDRKLPVRCAELIEDRTNEVAISPVSGYELRFKATKGLLPGGDALALELGELANRADILVLQLTLADALLAGSLPLPHRDPFDRLLSAQAQLHGYVILSADAALDALGAARFW